MAISRNKPFKEDKVPEIMEDLASAVELTQKMINGAKSGDWESVNKLSSERFSLLEKFFSEPVPDEMAADVEKAILQVQSLDRQLSVLCISERERLAHQLQSLDQSKKGAAAYNANS